MNSSDSQVSISAYKWHLIAILVLVLAAGFLDGMESAAAVSQHLPT
jgi:hypothetical protein